MSDLTCERRAWQAGYRQIAGVDEAGRGPTAGPVVTAAVILPLDWEEARYPIHDSKQVSESLREELFGIIRREVVAYKIVVISPQVIDQLNILQATLLGMKKAVEGLRIPADYVLVDGNKYPPLDLPGEALIQGDARSMSIAAASILAKVARDRIMSGWSRLYPQWRFEQHKGYPTAEHRGLVAKYGLSPIHRRSFRGKSNPAAKQLGLFD